MLAFCEIVLCSSSQSACILGFVLNTKHSFNWQLLLFPKKSFGFFRSPDLQRRKRFHKIYLPFSTSASVSILYRHAESDCHRQSVLLYFININIRGIVTADIRCDITAIPAATVVSFPKPLGITTVLSPKGIASEQSAQI